MSDRSGAPGARPLFLYDIDGTILSTRGAGRESLDLAFEQLFGVPGAFKGVRFGGRTDPGIIAQAFANAGLPGDADQRAALKRTYLAALEAALAREPRRVRLHPGVERSIRATAEIGTNSLLTGNWRAGAALKLGAVGLWDRFDFGAFGDDSPVRNDLVPVAAARARERGLGADRVIVIGDTEADVACARAGGAIAVAVLTGWADRERLEAASPDLLLEDLDSGLSALLALARG